MEMMTIEDKAKRVTKAVTQLERELIDEGKSHEAGKLVSAFATLPIASRNGANASNWRRLMPEHNTPPVVTEADMDCVNQAIKMADSNPGGPGYTALAAALSRITTTEALIAENARLREELETVMEYARAAGGILAPCSADKPGTPTRDALVQINAAVHPQARDRVKPNPKPLPPVSALETSHGG